MKLSKQALKRVLNGLLIFATFGMVVYFAFRSGDIGSIWHSLRGMDSRWLLGGLCCFLIHMFLEGGQLFIFLRFQGLRIRLRHCLKVGLIGMYYSSITPAATGGQPMQVFSMKRHGVPAGITSSALAVKFFCWQCALLLVGSLMWLFKASLINGILGQAIWMLRIGFLLNGIAVVLVILLAISRNAVRAIIIFLVHVAHKLRIVKNRERTSSRWDAALQDFHASVDILTRQPLQFLLLFVLSIVQVTGLMSATYFVYRGFGHSGVPYMDILSIQFMLFLAASFTPLPGASGAQEGGFYLFFKDYFPASNIFAALFVWRFLTYYLSIIIGFLAVTIDSATSGRASRQAALMPQDLQEDKP